MSVEIEVKYRVPDLGEVLRRVQEVGAPPAEEAAHVDRYLAHPARDFAQTDEAFRIRSGPGGNRLTYKGPKRGGPTKTREEIEVAFEPGAEGEARMVRLLERLGFRTVLTIAKTRREFHLVREGRPLNVALDQVEGLGSFAEVETLAESEGDVQGAQQAVLRLAGELGLTEVEPRSYLRMALERAANGAVRLKPDPLIYRPDPLD